MDVIDSAGHPRKSILWVQPVGNPVIIGFGKSSADAAGKIRAVRFADEKIVEHEGFRKFPIQNKMGDAAVAENVAGARTGKWIAEKIRRGGQPRDVFPVEGGNGIA